MSSFDDAVYHTLHSPEEKTGRKATAFGRVKLSLKQMSSEGAKISAVGNSEIHIGNLGLKHMSSIQRAFSVQAPTLELTDELMHFEPDPDLLFTSTAPLWVLEQTGPNSVCIKRSWTR